MSSVCRPQGVWPGLSIGRRWCRLVAQPLDLGHRGGAGPLLDEPLGQRVVRAAQRQHFVLVAATVREQIQRPRHLVIDLQAVAVGIGEIDAALADMIGGTLDLDAAFEQVGEIQRAAEHR